MVIQLMEITFESDNPEFDIVFESSILSENFSDQTKVCWHLHDGPHSGVVVHVLGCLPEDKDTTKYILPSV